jgi:hypothetical protein
MAHYAFLDETNTVVEVIVGKDEGEDGIDWEQWYGTFRGKTCKRTSYNTKGGVHQNGGTPFRKNYAGIGYRYDETLDAFIGLQPYPSWVLDLNSCIWKSPSPLPEDAESVPYIWNEDSLAWVERV